MSTKSDWSPYLKTVEEISKRNRFQLPKDFIEVVNHYNDSNISVVTEWGAME